jgi:undecaprenyl-diphosphatase
MIDLPGLARALQQMLSGRSGSRLARIGELLPLLALLAAATITAAIVELASEVQEGDTHAIDRAVLLALREAGDSGEPIGPAWLQGVMMDITALGGTSVLTLTTLAAVGYLVAARKGATALYLSSAVIGGALLTSGLKIGFGRPRPELVAHLVEVQSASFPSGHAANSAITFLTIGVLLARAEADWRLKLYLVGVAMGMTFLVGCSRVYLGVHWPSDVLAGWSVGAAWALLCWGVASWLQRRRAIEPS